MPTITFQISSITYIFVELHSNHISMSISLAVQNAQITAVANQFVIRKVDPNNSDFLYSSNLWSVAKAHGWWDESMGTYILYFLNVILYIELLGACLHDVIDFHPDLFLGLLDFAPTYAPQRAHSVYCTRRYPC